MADPFEILRDVLLPGEADPGFTARLRDRLARAFDLPKGVTVSNLTLHESASTTPEATAVAGARLTPYLAVRDARGAIAWYEDAFGARLSGEPVVMPDGSIGHAELDLGGAKLMLSEESPAIGVTAPAPEGVPVTLHLEVRDVDTVLADAVAAGARLERAAADYDYGRNGVLRDPFGHRWMIAASPFMRHHGDVGYSSLHVPDVARAASFYSAVLGWRYAPASGPGGRRVEGQTLHQGVWGGIEAPTLFCCYAVADISQALDRVEAAGGVAGTPAREPYGIVADCIDNQGVRFALYVPPEGVAPGRSTGDRTYRHGDLAYVTMQVVDSARARAFYGSVLGWEFTPGHVPDGWQVQGTDPLAGISGGHDRATLVPMYQVDDIRLAVEAVRHTGGTATDPEAQPYGVTSDCTDDQGTRFYLGQLS